MAEPGAVSTESQTANSPQWSTPTSQTPQLPQWYKPPKRSTSGFLHWSTPTSRTPQSPQWSEAERSTPTSSGEAQVATPVPVTSSPQTNTAQVEEPTPEEEESEEPASPSNEQEEPEVMPEPVANEAEQPESPLTHQQLQQPTAETLRQGEVVIQGRTRLFFIPDSAAAAGQEEETSVFFDGGFSWGITDELEISAAFQHVDSAFPGRQGDFDVILDDDNEAAFEAKYKIWQNNAQTLTLSGVFGLSLGPRSFIFREDGERRIEEDEFTVIPALQLPLTAAVDNWRFTLSPTIAFFSDDNAGFLSRLPDDDSNSFGTAFGLTGAVSVNLGSRLTLWGDAFIPFTGNNSISRESGEPDDAIAYNAGLRYLVNPQLGIDIFASNSLGSLGPLALTADRDFTAFGAGIVFMPDFVPANRRYRSEGEPSEDTAAPSPPGGIGFFDGGTLASGRFLFDIQSGSQGVLTSLRYGFVEDFEAGIYLDAIFGDVDESEQGISGKVQILNQAGGDPFTASIAATIGLSDQALINFSEDNRDELDERDLDQDIPFLLQGDDGSEGKLYIFTLSAPLNYQFGNGAALWFTPIWGYVQRNGTEIAGFNLGGSYPVLRNFSVVGEVGANLIDDGNAFIDDSRENAIPWTFAIRWDPSELLGLDPGTSDRPRLELYITNRVGSSTWHQLRVRDQNDTAVGVGLSVPFRF